MWMDTGELHSQFAVPKPLCQVHFIYIREAGIIFFANQYLAHRIASLYTPKYYFAFFFKGEEQSSLQES